MMRSKIVHVDLKGAQPLPPSKSPFWEQWCKYLTEKCHVSGLLIEWEDCLPLELLSSASSADQTRFTYTADEVKNIMQVAQIAGLEIIPLIQTFGHLEYLLKHESYAHLREVPEYLDCLIPAERADDKSAHLIFKLIEEVLSFTPAVSAIHLGGDEVWHLGQGERSQHRMSSSNMPKIELYLTHMNLVVEHVQH